MGAMSNARVDAAYEAMKSDRKARIGAAAKILAEALGMTREAFAQQLARGAGGSAFSAETEAVYRAMEQAEPPKRLGIGARVVG